MIPIYVATEDALSEAVADRLVAENDGKLEVSVRLGRKGNGHLRKKLPELIKLSKNIPVLLLTDLDQINCPPTLINAWNGRLSFPEGMLFRVAVREVEAWLLADCDAFSSFSGVPVNKLPVEPEGLIDPKKSLLNLVKKYGRAAVKQELLSEVYPEVTVGLGYNDRLSAFVRELWRPDIASQRSDSLNRARSRLLALWSK